MYTELTAPSLCIIWRSLYLLGSVYGLRRVENILEKDLNSLKLICLYGGIYEDIYDVIKHKIYEVLNTRYLDKNKLDAYAVDFLYKVIHPRIHIDDLCTISKSYGICLKDTYINFLESIAREVRKTKYAHFEDIIYAVSVLLDKDVWIINRFKMFSYDFIFKLVEKIRHDYTEPINVMAKLVFAVVSVLAALLCNIPSRRENLDKLTWWSKCFAEDVDSYIEILDAQLMAEFDPQKEVEFRLEAAEYFLEEAKRFIKVGDSVQASEKLYKVAEECIKALEAKYKVLKTMEEEEVTKYVRETFPRYLLKRILDDLKRYKKEGKWSSMLYRIAAIIFAEKFNEPLIREAWEVAYHLHVVGFHEMELDISHVESKLQTIEQLLAKVRKLLT